MRYELFLTRLPKLDAQAVEAEFGDVAEGLSAGVLKKALEGGNLPLIAVGWGEDRANMKRVQARLRALGGECKLKDHAALPVRAYTGLKELGSGLLQGLGLSRPEAEPQRSKKVVRVAIGERSGQPASIAAAFAIEVAVAGVLYAGYALTLGGSPGLEVLLPRLGVVAFGVACAHALKLGVAAALAQRISVFAAAPTVVVPLSALMFAILNLHTPEAAHPPPPAEQKTEEEELPPLPPPPSRPFQGLVEELRIRKLRALERALQEVRGSAAPLSEAAAELGLKPAAPATPAGAAVNAKNAALAKADTTTRSLLIATGTIALGLLAALAALAFRMRAQKRRFQIEREQIERRYEERATLALQQLQSLQKQLEQESGGRITLQRTLADEVATRETAERNLERQAAEHATARSTLERELETLRAAPERAAPALRAAAPARTDRRPDAAVATAARPAPAPPAHPDSDPLPAALGGPLSTPRPAPMPARKPLPAAPAPRGSQERGAEQRSSYAVFDVGEERISIPKHDKR